MVAEVRYTIYIVIDIVQVNAHENWLSWLSMIIAILKTRFMIFTWIQISEVVCK